jgi:hypothetical protein
MINKAAFLTFTIFVLALLTLPAQTSSASQAGFDLPQPNAATPWHSNDCVEGPAP